MTDVLPCLIHVELLRAVSGLRTSVSVTWQRTCCLDTTRCFLFPLHQTGPGLKDLYLWTGEVLHDVSILKGCQQISLQQINSCLGECVCVCVVVCSVQGISIILTDRHHISLSICLFRSVHNHRAVSWMNGSPLACHKQGIQRKLLKDFFSLSVL